jgi:hypothetical protein
LLEAIAPNHASECNSLTWINHSPDHQRFFVNGRDIETWWDSAQLRLFMRNAQSWFWIPLRIHEWWWHSMSLKLGSIIERTMLVIADARWTQNCKPLQMWWTNGSKLSSTGTEVVMMTQSSRMLGCFLRECQLSHWMSLVSFK